MSSANVNLYSVSNLRILQTTRRALDWILLLPSADFEVSPRFSGLLRDSETNS